MGAPENPWDDYADQYAEWLARRDPGRLDAEDIPSRLLDLLGDIAGRNVLDAGCSERFLSRHLAARGAKVTGIDLSPKLIQKARTEDSAHIIDYRVGDLSQPLPELVEHFDCVGSYLVLNDVQDYRGFAATLASVAKSGARIVLAFNNPYSSVIRIVSLEFCK